MQVLNKLGMLLEKSSAVSATDISIILRAVQDLLDSNRLKSGVDVEAW